MTHITFKKITLFLIATYVLLFIPRMVLAVTCPSVNGVITTDAGPIFANLGCTSQPTTQRVRVLKASLCTSSPSAATTLAAIGKAAAGCQVIFTSDDAAGDSVDIINGTTVNLTGSAIIPPIGTYSHLVVEINPTMATIASNTFNAAVSDHGTAGTAEGVFGITTSRRNVTSGVFCVSQTVNINNWRSNNFAQDNSTVRCGANLAATGAAGLTSTFMNSLENGANVAALMEDVFPTSLPGNPNMNVSLLTATDLLATVAGINQQGNVAKIVGVIPQTIVITSKTESFDLLMSNTDGVGLDMGTETYLSSATNADAGVATQQLNISSFMPGVFDMRLTPVEFTGPEQGQ